MRRRRVGVRKLGELRLPNLRGHFGGRLVAVARHLAIALIAPGLRKALTTIGAAVNASADIARLDGPIVQRDRGRGREVVNSPRLARDAETSARRQIFERQPLLGVLCLEADVFRLDLARLVDGLTRDLLGPLMLDPHDARVVGAAAHRIGDAGLHAAHELPEHLLLPVQRQRQNAVKELRDRGDLGSVKTAGGLADEVEPHLLGECAEIKPLDPTVVGIKEEPVDAPLSIGRF